MDLFFIKFFGCLITHLILAGLAVRTLNKWYLKGEEKTIKFKIVFWTLAITTPVIFLKSFR